MKKYKVLAAFVSLKGGKTFRFGQIVTSEQLSKDEAEMWVKNGHIELDKKSAKAEEKRLAKEAKEKEEAELARLEAEEKSLTNAVKKATK